MSSEGSEKRPRSFRSVMSCEASSGVSGIDALPLLYYVRRYIALRTTRSAIVTGNTTCCQGGGSDRCSHSERKKEVFRRSVASRLRSPIGGCAVRSSATFPTLAAPDGCAIIVVRLPAEVSLPFVLLEDAAMAEPSPDA